MKQVPTQEVNYQYDEEINAELSHGRIASTSGNLQILGNTSYGAETTPIGIGFRTTGATGPNIIILNNIFYGLATAIEIGTVQQDTIFEDYNTFYNCTTNRTRIATGSNSLTTNPSFTSISHITGTNGTTSGSVLTSSGADFSIVTDNVDYVRIVSGTGVTAMNYPIISHTLNTLTLNTAPGTNATADKVFVIYLGHNFLPTANI